MEAVRNTAEPRQRIPQLTVDPTSPSLGENAATTLNTQWREFWKLRMSSPSPSPEVDVAHIRKGELLHNLRYDEALVAKILKSGILSGELGYGEKETRPEDAETHYCADFFVNEDDKTIAEYVAYANGDEEGFGRIRKKRIESYVAPKEQSDGIAIVVDPTQPELAYLMQNAATGIEREKLRQFGVRFPWEDRPDITKRHMAVLVGVPANFIKSMIVGGKVSNDPEKLARLKQVVAESGLDVSILNYAGVRL